MLACLSAGWEEVKGENHGGGGFSARFQETFFVTSATFPAGELQPDTAVELQGDESVGHHHDDSGDEEEQQQQGHVPEGSRRRIRQSALTPSHPTLAFPGWPSLASCIG